jgi:hypothetical protein
MTDYNSQLYINYNPPVDDRGFTDGFDPFIHSWFPDIMSDDQEAPFFEDELAFQSNSQFFDRLGDQDGPEAQKIIENLASENPQQKHKYLAGQVNFGVQTPSGNGLFGDLNNIDQFETVSIPDKTTYADSFQCVEQHTK